jgi:hypothetical protein
VDPPARGHAVPDLEVLQELALFLRLLLLGAEDQEVENPEEEQRQDEDFDAAAPSRALRAHRVRYAGKRHHRDLRGILVIP